MRALEIIMNVDDLGLHPAVRRAVETCASLGTVTSASVLANGPDLAAVRAIPGVSLGAHLNILRGAPLSPAHEVRSLVDKNGLFLGSAAKLAWRVACGALKRDEIRLEWSRQVALLREKGLTLSHVDGEKHTHCLPGLFSVACDVAAEHGIRWVRRSDERFGNFRAGGRGSPCALARTLRVRTHDPIYRNNRRGLGNRGTGCVVYGGGLRTCADRCRYASDRGGLPPGRPPCGRP